LVERATAKSKPVINNERNQHHEKRQIKNSFKKQKQQKKSRPVSRISVFLKIKSYPPALFWQASCFFVFFK